MKKVRVKLLWKPSRLLMNYFENIHTEAIYLKERTKAFSDQIREGGIQRVQSPSFSLNNFYMVEQLSFFLHLPRSKIEASVRNHSFYWSQVTGKRSVYLLEPIK